ncbi:MAG: calcium/sodium antiporter, partial [Coriobacteriia bacterium]
AGTSAPELLVSVSAALKGNADIAIGNVVGSNIFNVLGVLGISALIAPIIVKPAEVKRDTLIMVVAMIALAAAAQFGVIGWPVGLVLIAAIVGYTVYSYRTELREKPAPSAELHEHEGEEFEGPSSLWLGLLYIALGLGALVIGSQLLVSGATDIARTFGVPEAVIGLTLVAIGTSLPELATSIAAAFRGHSDVAVGNVVGSNIFNALFIIGATAIVRPIHVAESMARLDVWIMVAVALVLIPLLIGRGRIGRLAGAVLTAAYVAYAVMLLA